MSQDTERIQVSEGHSQTVDHGGTSQGTKESERATGTHFLLNTEAGASQDRKKESEQATGTHGLCSTEGQ